MKIITIMQVEDFFKLSTGQIALVGYLDPNLNEYIPACKSDLYLDNLKIATINIIGEDRFSGTKNSAKINRRAVRTDANISDLLTKRDNKKIKLVLYKKDF